MMSFSATSYSRTRPGAGRSPAGRRRSPPRHEWRGPSPGLGSGGSGQAAVMTSAPAARSAPLYCRVWWPQKNNSPPPANVTRAVALARHRSHRSSAVMMAVFGIRVGVTGRSLVAGARSDGLWLFRALLLCPRPDPFKPRNVGGLGTGPAGRAGRSELRRRRARTGCRPFRRATRGPGDTPKDCQVGTLEGASRGRRPERAVCAGRDGRGSRCGASHDAVRVRPPGAMRRGRQRPGR